MRVPGDRVTEVLAEKRGGEVYVFRRRESGRKHGGCRRRFNLQVQRNRWHSTCSHSKITKNANIPAVVVETNRE